MNMFRPPIPDSIKHLKELASWHFTVSRVRHDENGYSIEYMERGGHWRATKATATEARAWWLLCGQIDGIAN